jgi:CyaY protein
MTMPDYEISEQDFRSLVSDVLRDFAEQLDEVEDDDIDPVLTDGVLSCAFEERGGTFVLSQQVPVRELWLSANRSAWHFRYAGGEWKERDSGEDMAGLLSALFSEKLGLKVRFTYPEG